MGGGSSKAKRSKAKMDAVQALGGGETGADELSVAEMAQRSRATKGAIKPLVPAELDGGGFGAETPDLPKTFSESLRESPPDDDFLPSDDLLADLSRGGAGGGGTPKGFGQRSSTWEAAPVQASPARPVGGDDGAFCAGEATDIGGRKENQDTSFGISLLGGKVWVGAVFDGHGSEGKAAAEYARDRVQSVMQQRAAQLVQRPEDVLRDAFAGAHSGMAMAADCTYSGTTATCCILSKERIVTGWVGDSRAVIGRRNGKATLALTDDHRPELLEEAQRIASAGGLIRRANGNGPMRVYGGAGGAVGLMLTRSLGDMEMHEYGVSAEPQIATHQLRSGKDELLLLGSDGVFDAMNNEEALKLAGGAAEKEKGGGSAGAMAGAGAVVGQAAAWWRRNPGSDNITAIVVTPLRQ